jgi:hypothetical protein
MNKLIFRNFIMMAGLAIITTFGFVACDKENVNSTTQDATEALTDESSFTLEQRGNLGKHGCYDLVFPLGIKFSDGLVVNVTSQDSLRKAIKAWHISHGGSRHERPDFVYPIQVIAEDGSVIEVADQVALITLKKACRKNHLDSLHRRDSLHHHGFPRHDTLCFTLVFPIQVTKEDGTIITINTKEELKNLTQGEHRKGRGHGHKHGLRNQLNLVFPISVIKSDGTTISVASKEALKALREGC